MQLLLLAVAGAGGALCRYGIYRALTPEGPTSALRAFPWATVVANGIGCLLFGLVVVLAEEAKLVTTEQRVILLAGFLGSFTTFSTFAYETTAMLQAGHVARATINVLAQSGGGVLCIYAGLAAGRALAGGSGGT